MATTALVGVLPPVAIAQEVIDDTTGTTGNASETVNGGGGGTQASPWNIGDDLYVGEFSTGTLTIENGGTVSVDAGYISVSPGAAGTVTVTGVGSTWTNTDGLYVGNAAAGTLTIADSGSVSGAFGVIGNLSVGTGSVSVTGSGSTWTNSGLLWIGNSGAGTLTIADGGTVSNDDGVIGNGSSGMGTVTVTGPGSTWDNASTLQVGDAGTGTLTIADGGAVSVNSGIGTVTIADDLGSTGTLNIGDGARAGILNAATVDGGDGTATLTFNHTDTDYFFTNDGTSTGTTIAITGTVAVNHIGTGTTTLTGTNTYTGSTIVNFGTLAVDGGSITHTSADLIVGGVSGDDGTLTIENGGSVSNDEAGIGYAAGSEGAVSVTGAGSTWTNSGTLYVGLAGSGTLTIADGGSVSNTAGTVGFVSGATGTVTVTGAGSSWSSSSDLYVGESGTGTMNIEDGATASVGDDVMLGFNATGNGTLTVDGAGSELDVTDAFVVGRAGTGVLTVQNSGILTGNYSYVGNSTGATGTATITGSGSSWTLTGDLYIAEQGTGTMTIADGGTVSNAVSYIGYDSGSVGAVTVTGAGSTWTNNSTLYVGEDGDGTLTISDGGTVSAVGVEIASASGSSVVNIGAAEGDAAVAAGTLDTSAIVFGSGNGELVFNHTDTAYDFDAAIFGLGSIEHFAGVTNLTADNSGFAGETVVSGGSLYVNDSLGGTIYVDGGTLSGSGTAGALTVNFGGNLAPGNSIGTLNVASAIFNAGSTYTVELNDGGFVAGTNNDLLNATGAVTINGGTVNVTSENGTDDGSTYAAPGTYTIITAGSVTGTFDSVSDDYVFLDFTDSYDATNVYLTSEQVVFFSDIAETPNQQAIASPLEALGSGNAVYDALVGLVGDEDDARAAFDSLTGEIHASARTALLEDSRFPREAAMDRLRVALGGVGADNGAQIEDRISESFGMWGQGFGSWSQWNSDGNAAALDRTIGGFLMGGDALVWDNARFGVLGGYSRSHFSGDDRLSSGTADTYTLGLYGGGEWDAFTLTGGLAHSWHSLDTSRSVAFTGFSDSLSASYNARTLQAWGEAAVSFEAGAARIEPFADLAYVNLSTDGFTESGGAAALTAASNVVDATFTTLGLRAETDVALGDIDATLRGMVGWRHAFGGAPASQMAFASGGNAFTIAGVPLAQDSLVLDVGFDVNLTGNATLGFAYGGQFGSGVQDHSATASLNVRF